MPLRVGFSLLPSLLRWATTLSASSFRVVAERPRLPLLCGLPPSLDPGLISGTELEWESAELLRRMKWRLPSRPVTCSRSATSPPPESFLSTPGRSHCCACAASCCAPPDGLLLLRKGDSVLTKWLGSKPEAPPAPHVNDAEFSCTTAAVGVQLPPVASVAPDLPLSRSLPPVGLESWPRSLLVAVPPGPRADIAAVFTEPPCADTPDTDCMRRPSAVSVQTAEPVLSRSDGLRDPDGSSSPRPDMCDPVGLTIDMCMKMDSDEAAADEERRRRPEIGRVLSSTCAQQQSDLVKAPSMYHSHFRTVSAVPTCNH